MKKRFFYAPGVLLITLLMFVLTACGSDSTCQHRDADDNSLCDKCGESYTDGKDLLDDPVHTHSYTVKNIDSTYLDKVADCENAATYFYSCSCGDKGTETFTNGNANGHSYTVKNNDDKYLDKAADCENAATYFYSCVCGATGIETFTHENPLGHSPKTAVEENRVEATCTEDGHYDSVVYCNRCDEELSRQTITITVQQHKPTKGLVCSVCGEKVAYYRDGNYIYFGEYPQTIKADSVTITSTQDSRGYYLGSDGCYYAKVVADSWGSGYTFSTGASVTDGATYYFKVEPIRWRILSEDGETVFILCDSIIANHRYDDSSNNYKESEIRQWLNATFYETAFTELQRALIMNTTVDNSVYSTGYSSNPCACENTNDKIFLLSYREVTNSAYGFSSNSDRTMQTSDYSRASGVCMNTSSSYYGNGFWWLRSPYNFDSIYARCVTDVGIVGYYVPVNFSNNGVVPALRIRL